MNMFEVKDKPLKCNFYIQSSLNYPPLWALVKMLVDSEGGG